MKTDHEIASLQPVAAVQEPASRWRPIWLAAALALAGVLALAVDLPVARWFLDGHCPRDLQRLCGLAEAFAQGSGAAMILLGVFVLDPARRRSLPRAIVASLGSGIIADVLKYSLARTRPYHFDFHGGVLTTFGHWWPLWTVDASEQSFPSAHAATAAGMVVALSWLYPRGRWYFVLLAVLAGCQRLTGGSHFLSDVLWGAALGSLWSCLCVRRSFMSGWFDRFERFERSA